jgi:hypothetical protein
MDLLSKNRKKFDEWLQKVRSILKSADKSSLNELPTDFKFLRYWGEKLKIEDPKDFATTEKAYMSLACEVGDALNSDYLSFLKKAEKHAKGTKARLVEILRYVYYYSNYAHDCFIEGGQENQAKKILKPFWRAYGNEIIENKELLHDFQIDSVLRLVKQSRDVGIEIKNEWVSVLEDMIRLPDPLLLAQCKNQLKNAEENLAQEETIAAIVLADQALELLLRDLCTRFGCDNDTLNKKGEPFRKWGFADYIIFLSKKREINKYEKANFFRFHEWRNSAYHHGLEPSVRLVRNVIDEIARFIEEHSY